MVVAPDAPHAVDMVTEIDCDVVLLDMKLPSADGLDTFFAIRELNPKIAVILITGYRQEMGHRMEEGLKHGVYSYLYKPFDVEEVLGLLRAICDRKHRDLLEGPSRQ